jgi:hypothetical protein
MPTEIERLEAELVGIREKANEEVKRHLMKMAELTAEEARVESEIRAATAQQRRLRLSTVRPARTVPNVNLRRYLPPVPKSPGRKSSPSDHPFRIALTNAGTNAAQWGRDNGISEERVKSWYKTGSGLRPIPMLYAKVIEAQFGLPADESTWPQGIIPEGKFKMPRARRA